MNAQEAAERVEKMVVDINIGEEDKKALWAALEALRGNPCAVCIYSPPKAGDGRPCVKCPATGAIN